MARAGKLAKKPIEQYAHKGKMPVNNPPVVSGEPKKYKNCEVDSCDPQTHLVQISERGERPDFEFDIFWPR